MLATRKFQKVSIFSEKISMIGRYQSIFASIFLAGFNLIKIILSLFQKKFHYIKKANIGYQILKI